MSTRAPFCLPPAVDPAAFAGAVWFWREDLRRIPESISAAMELTRAMLIELDAGPEDKPEWITQRSIDAVLGCAKVAADHLYRSVTDLVGEDDSDVHEVEVRLYREQAAALRAATPPGMAPEEFARGLVLRALAPAGA